MNNIGRTLARIVALLSLLVGSAAQAAPFHWESFGTDQIVIRLKDGASLAQPGRGRELAASLTALGGEDLRYRRTTGEGAKVLRLKKRLPLAAVEALARNLARHSEVLEAIPDRIAFPALLDPPNDTQYANQWSLGDTDGIRALGAWDITTGSSQQVVAVIDTGILAHADLGAGRILPGYDFVSDGLIPRSNDGDGRDVDPTDPGDWISAEEAGVAPYTGCPQAASSWHGTVMAGIIAAEANNALGIAGINWNTKILPLRALGKCGGYSSDIADAVRWAAGLSVLDIPDNANPADLINLSLAIPTLGACDAQLQTAINEVVAANIPVIVAAGNQAGAASGYSPGNCANVITVGAVSRDGGIPAYANTGSPILLSAPGGIAGDASTAVLAPFDSGSTVAANDNIYAPRFGTSIAAAHVTGVVSLMQSVKPTLSPAEIRDIIKNTTRAFPAAGTPCTTSACGRGILDAHAAVQAALAYGNATPGVATGGVHSGGVRSDGTIWTWGAGNFGKLGDNNTLQRNNPVQAQLLGAGNFMDASSLSLGGDHSLATRPDTTAWGWGVNTFGRLGDGTTTARSGAVTACATGSAGTCVTLTGVVQVAAGSQHSLALKNDGTVWAWGAGDNGQRGDNTVSLTSSNPVQVCASSGCGTKLTGVIAIAAGDLHSLALKSDGTVFAWGHNGSGRLGIGSTTTPQKLPVQVCDSTGCGTPLSNVIAIGGGKDHSVAVKGDGTAWAWGGSTAFQLGNPTAGSPQTTPIQVLTAAATPLTGVAAAVAGNSFSLALKSDGTVYGWGLNSNGQLGIGSAGSAQSYAVPAPAMSNVARIAASGTTGAHGLAIRTNGTIYAFGLNTSGQLGIAPLTSTPAGTPVLVQAGAGGDFTLQLNTSTFIAQFDAPLESVRQSNSITISGVGSNVPISISAPSEYSIGCNGSFTTAAGTVSNGQTVCVRLVTSSVCATPAVATLTVNTVNDYPFTVTTEACDSTPAPFIFATQGSAPVSTALVSNAVTISGINTTANIGVSAGGEYSIGCNGSFTPTASMIGNGQTVCVRQTSSASNDTATQVTLTVGGVSVPFYVITVPSGLSVPMQAAGGTAFSAGLRTNGMMFLWGSNGNAQLGDSTTNSMSIPLRLGSLSGVTQASLGFGHVLARRSDGTVWAWGYNGNGQLGDGGTMQRGTPLPVPGISSALAVSAGFLHSLALKADTTVWAWGYNGFGQLGDGTTTHRFTPVQVLEEVSGLPLANVSAIVAGGNHSLALKADGTLWAWGRNNHGQVGDGTNTGRPKAVQILTNVAALAPGSSADHAMIRKIDGTIWLWGRNDFGQLGNGCTLTPSNTCADLLTPTQVASLSSVVELAVGERHAAVLKGDGSVWTWGFNGDGQLGDGTTNPRSTPAQVAGLAAQKIGAGASHTLAVRPDGSVAAWGYNGSGQVGDGTSGGGTSSQDRKTPVSVLGAGCSGSLNLDVNAGGFTAQTAVPESTLRCSNTIAITGIANGSTITINTGTNTPQYQIDSNAFTSASGTINNGQSLTVRQTSAATCGTTTLAIATINGTPHTFSVTTGACDTTPDEITFTAQTDVPLSSERISNTVTITGVNTAVDITVSGGEYSIGCNTPFTSAAGTVSSGAMVCVRHTSAATVSTLTTTTLTVGTIQAAFTSTTAPLRPLSVSLSGSGSGTVTSTSPASPSINCGVACTADFEPGASVTLQATPAGDSVFAGWSGGGCSGTGTCVVPMNAPQFVVATFNLIPPVLNAVKSRKTHGGAGTFDLTIAAQPIGGTVTVEPRVIGAGHRVVFQFDRAITSAGTVACVDSGSVACSANAVANGNEIEVTITGLADRKRVTVSLTNVNGLAANYSASLGFSAGDVDSTRSTTASDILRAKGSLGLTADALTFLHDIDLSGVVSQIDVDAVKANVGTEI